MIIITNSPGGVYRVENRKSSSSHLDRAERQALYQRHRDQSYRSSVQHSLHHKSGTQRVSKDHTKNHSPGKSNWRLRYGGGQRGWQNYMGAHEQSHS